MHGVKRAFLGMTTELQLKALRILDASCNDITKIEGLSENKVNGSVQ